ncbi:MAG: phosphotransferase enzyme family protein [Ilumatobacteraceae bacterium]
MPAEYRALPTRAQIAALRPSVRTALGRYGLDAVRIRLLLHDFNTSFRIDTADGRRFALRINVHSRREPGNLEAEAAWLGALRNSTIPVPAPVPTVDGRPWTAVWSDVLGREVPVVLMTWLPGRDLDGVLDTAPRSTVIEAVTALGRTMAALHCQAASWRPPSGAWLPALDRVECDRFDRLHPASAPVVHDAADLVRAAIDSVSTTAPVIPLHADLHAGNVKWFRRRIAVFDFDDSAMGVPAQDLAIAAYYLRDDEIAESAMIDGYSSVAEPPDVPPEQFEALVAGRNLQILHDVLGGIGAADRDFAAAYERNTVVKLRAFLASGRYRHDVPGLEAISL